MARIAGVNIPTGKRVDISLTYIYGVGRVTARNICTRARVDFARRVFDLTEEEVSRIREAITSHHRVEGDLRQEISRNIKELIDIKCYRGTRHLRNLPVRGQRTHTNARTRRGRRISVANKKKL